MDQTVEIALSRIAIALEQVLINQAALTREVRGLREPLVAIADALHDALDEARQLVKCVDDVAQGTAEIAHQITARGGG